MAALISAMSVVSVVRTWSTMPSRVAGATAPVDPLDVTAPLLVLIHVMQELLRKGQVNLHNVAGFTPPSELFDLGNAIAEIDVVGDLVLPRVR
jgi:hypothetical protein